MDKFIVMTAAAKMPGNCWGTYKRVAVVETDGEHMPKQINPTHKAVKRIVQTWEKLNVGYTSRCAFEKAKAEAEKLTDKLNSEIG